MKVNAARSPRRSEALSTQRIVDAAVAILDAGGEDALTFRALAAALATGPGAIYWHVANKTELLATATDAIIAEATGTAKQGKPRDEIREIALRLFDAFDAHPWVGSQLSRESLRLASTRILEAVGSRLGGLGVPADKQFDAASALASYICGAAGQNAANARNAPPDTSREAFLTRAAEQWMELDATEFPFVRQIAAEFPSHEDREQYLTGIDLILTGITAN